MIIPRVSSTLLKEVSMDQLRSYWVKERIDEMNREKLVEEQSKLLGHQEAIRIMRNIQYERDTQELRQYAYYEGMKEQRLLARSTVRGIFIDRYV
jgi:hypothetical protein